MIQDFHFAGKKILFITTKNLDYIRITQEIKMLEEKALQYQVIGSYSMSYPIRILTVYWKLLCTSVADFDIIFLGFAPQLVLPFWGWKFRKKALLIDFFLSFYDTLCCDRKWIRAGSLPGKLLHRLDEMVLRKADFIICDAKAHGQYFSREFQVPSQKLHTMYLQADERIYHPLNCERPEELKDKYIVLYFGSVLPLQGVDIVFMAMERLKKEKELYFFFIGPVSDRHMREIMPVSGNIEYIDWLPQEKLAEYIDMADLCLVGHFNAAIQKARRTIPGKAYIYHAMNKRMILGDNPANHELFDKDKKATFVEMGNDKALADAILRNMKQDKNSKNEY